MALITRGFKLRYVTAADAGFRLSRGRPLFAAAWRIRQAPIAGDIRRLRDVAELKIPRAGHWIAEENPEALLAGVKTFLRLMHDEGRGTCSRNDAEG